MNLKNKAFNIGLEDFFTDETTYDLQMYLEFLEQENKRLRNTIKELSNEKAD